MDKKKIFLFYILPIFLWMAFIFYLSSGVSLKDAILHPDYFKEAVALAKEHKVPPVNPEFTILDDLLNNTAHVFVFGVLAFLIYRYYGIVTLAIFYTALYGVFDEFHQIFIPLRSASLEDVVFDVIGAVLGVYIAVFLKKRGMINIAKELKVLKL